VEEPDEAVAKRAPQPRWVGFIIIGVLVVLSLTVLPTVRRRVNRFFGA
jgi:hypothetical protein